MYLSEFEFEALKKIGAEGANNSAEALSVMMEKKIGMGIPFIKILPLTEVPDAMGGAEKVVAGIFLTAAGPAPCNIMFIFPIENAKSLAGHLVEYSYSEKEEIDVMGRSALSEVGNVVSGAYLKSLADFTEMEFIPSVPALAIDMAGAVLDSVLARVGMTDDMAVLMETVFSEIEQNVIGHFFLLPEAGSLDKILQAIGVKE